MVWAASTVIALGSAAATIGGAALGSRQASKAADSQAAGNAAGIAENRRQFDVAQTNMAPYLAAGKNALGQFTIENDTPLDLTKIQMDPGYEFGRAQGQQAIDRKMAAGGGRISGAALKSAAQFGTDYATSGYSTAYGRANQTRTDRLNRLAEIAGIGQTATQNMGTLGAQVSGRNSALMTAAGDNLGSAQIAQGNIWGEAGNQLAALYGRNRTPSPKAGEQYTASDPYFTSGNY
jgi:hypothetical protein